MLPVRSRITPARQRISHRVRNKKIPATPKSALLVKSRNRSRRMANAERAIRAFPDNVDTVMRGLVPRIHVFHVFLVTAQGVDGRDKRGHDVIAIQANREMP